MLYAMIMAGGSGTRFWPASRRARPKQLLQLFGETSMLQASVGRLAGLVERGNVRVLTNHLLVEATRRQLPALSPDAILGEPCKRDTAPCIALAAALIAREDPEATLLVTPADHVIPDVDRFHEDVRKATALVDSHPELLVTFGISPTYPAQVFGYIERGDELAPGVFKVSRFREKPDEPTARQFVESGRFFWNAGIFAWRCRTILEAIGQYEPEMLAIIQAIADSRDSADWQATLQREFALVRGKSIDYAVMEHYPNVAVVQASFAWDDVGNWTALRRLIKPDQAGNAAAGRALWLDSKGCVSFSEGDHLIVALGLQDCMVVHTADATLVASVSSEGDLKRVVEELEARGWEEYL